MSKKADAETILWKWGWSIHSSEHDPYHKDFSTGNVDARNDKKSSNKHHSNDDDDDVDDIETLFVAPSDKEEDYRQSKMATKLKMEERKQMNGHKDGPDNTTEMEHELNTCKAQLSKWS